MVNLFIYTGFGILLIGAVYGLFIAIKGFKTTDWTGSSRNHESSFNRGKNSPIMKKLTKIWYVTMLIGFMFIATGITIGLD